MSIKNNKGITLIALVITIIVLLILAGVTISMVLGDDGIIAQAQQAKKAQEKGTGRDEGAISLAEGVISQYSMGKYDVSKKEIATQNSTINGQSASASNPVIPKGFKAVDVGEAKWSEGAVDKGLVIEDSVGNQFVWVPVSNMNNFKVVSGVYGAGSSNREPDLVTGATTAEGIADLVNGNSYDAVERIRKAILEDGYANSNEGLKKQFKDEYNAMKKSVETYGGFYVGRYETSWTGSKVASVPNVEPMNGNTPIEFVRDSDWNGANWYTFYNKQKELYKKDSSSSVVSGMIYGCQWDAIMNWMSSDDTTAGFVTNSDGKGNYSRSPINTGSNPDYAVKNIYDLAGNYFEWTQEAYDSIYRIARGGYYNYSGSNRPASYRFDDFPTSAYDSFSSRLQLYIK